MGLTSSAERNKENPQVVKPQENIQSSQSVVVTQKTTPVKISNECCSDGSEQAILDQVKLTSNEVQSVSQKESKTCTLSNSNRSPCNTNELNTSKEKKDHDVKTEPQCINSANLQIKDYNDDLETAIIDSNDSKELDVSQHEIVLNKEDYNNDLETAIIDSNDSKELDVSQHEIVLNKEDCNDDLETAIIDSNDLKELDVSQQEIVLNKEDCNDDLETAIIDSNDLKELDVSQQEIVLNKEDYNDDLETAIIDSNDSKELDVSQHEIVLNKEDYNNDLETAIIDSNDSKELDVSQYEIVWNKGGKDVAITGSFNDWKEHVVLSNINAGSFSKILFLKKGSYHFKFIVDGVWVCDNDKEKEDDGFGGFNNIIVVN